MSNKNGTPASEEKVSINTLVDQKISEDTDFQASLADLSDEEKNAKIAERKQELLDEEYSTLHATNKKNEELAGNYKTRAEKAEKGKKKDGESDPNPDPAPQDGLTPMDAIIIGKANVHQDDIQEVIDYAKFKKISIAEALDSSVIKTSLKEKAEKRATAEATNTRGGRPGNAAPSGDKLLEKAQTTGELPDTDAGIDALAQARLDKRKKK